MVIDRSGSMGVIDWDWPRGTNPFFTSTLNAGVAAGLLTRGRFSYFYAPGVSDYDYRAWAWEEHYGLGPAPTSPWMDLLAAVDAFLDVLDSTSQEEQVSLASYSTNATLDTLLEKDHDIVRQTVGSLEPNGWTAIGRGMQEGIQALLDTAARPFAAKTMVVMTDGIHNFGTDPATVAQQFVNSFPLTIHTVTFGEGADQSKMQQVADIGGGRHFHAATGEQLIAIFEEIANNLPTIMAQ